MNEASHGKISDVQVLRALAVIAVVLHHLRDHLLPQGAPAFITHAGNYFGGAVGVDLFLVISGFVIARGLIPELNAATSIGFWPVVAHFWARRAVRLLPAAWFWLAATLALTLGFNASGAFTAFSVNLAWAIKAVLQVANFHFAMVLPFRLGALPHYWSLSLEEQFYLGLPFLLWLSGRRLPLVLLGLCVLQCLPLSSTEPYWWSFRLMPLSLGVLLGLGHVRGWLVALEPRFLLRHRGWGLAALCLGACCLFGLMGEATRFVSLRAAYGMAAWASFLLVWLASYDLKLFSAWAWFERAAVAVGNRSYSIYLTHLAAFCAARESLFRWGGGLEPGTTPYALVAMGLGGALVVLATELTHRWLELRWQRAWAPALADLGARKRQPGMQVVAP